MTLQYLIISIFSFAVITFVMIRALRKNFLPPRNDDEGGTPVDTTLPTYDPPSGNGLDDLLIDRPPKNWYPKPTNEPVSR